MYLTQHSGMERRKTQISHLDGLTPDGLTSDPLTGDGLTPDSLILTLGGGGREEKDQLQS